VQQHHRPWMIVIHPFLRSVGAACQEPVHPCKLAAEATLCTAIMRVLHMTSPQPSETRTGGAALACGKVRYTVMADRKICARGTCPVLAHQMRRTAGTGRVFA
jgi:hypothetical protein